MENPEDFMVEEREEYMISSTGGNPFLKLACFLKPTSSSSINEPPLKLTHCFSSLRSHSEPNKWPLKVQFRGWPPGREDWKTWVGQMASVHQPTWEKAGIYEAITNSTYHIRRENDLVYGFAEKWCSETNTFIFPWGEATITLEDVMVLGGYSVLGDSVLSPLEIPRLKQIQKKLLELRKEICKSAGLKEVSTNLWQKKFMNSGNEFEHEAFLVFWLSRYVFLGANYLIHTRVFSIAIHLAMGTRIALAPAVLASVYRDLGLLKGKIVASNQLKIDDAFIELVLKSPLQLVQVWAWERFLELRPKPNGINYAEPRMARWDKVNGPKVQNLRMVLDSAGGDFQWRPYAMAIENWNLPKCYPHWEKWVCVGPDLDDELLSFVRCLRVSELVGLGTIEHYLPHRVAMQFGYDQDLPCSVSRPNHNSDIAWKHYNKEIKNVKLYLPCRLFEADVSTKYLKWWKQSVSGLEEAAVPRKKRTKRVKLLVSPGFPPKRKRMEAEDPIDEDKLTVSEFLKYCKKHENFGIIQGSDGEKLSSQAQHFASSPIAQESYVNTMKSDENIVSLVSDEFQKRQSELEARFKRIKNVVDELYFRKSL
ncbi:protein MAINTENANCE OF MERISTEMS [Prunus persica]|uniref:protein MAINTENANCE OF MERISTEMS n=1 Tax=Prunus persica TaxID=3760 RepID=UPI0009AB847D|nr:protein MAINTENANCE OF MERISTEMS [Prunus persica]